MSALILTVLGVILISALCSLFEAVLYSVSHSEIEALAEAQRPAGQMLRELRANVDRPITAILSLNTISNTAGATLAGALATQVFGDEWFLAFSIAFTFSILLFSEVLPKTAGVVYNRPLAPILARPLKALVWLLTPLLYLSGLITRAVAGSRPEAEISGEEIAVLARLGSRKGVIHKDHGVVIENILSLESKTASQVMTPRTVLFSLSVDLTVDEAHRMEGALTHSRIPIYDGSSENIVGIVLRHDILAAVARKELDCKLESLVRPVHFVLDKTNLSRVFKMLLDRSDHMFVALDEFGGLAGVVTFEDVLEEVLGKEIVDELDQVTDMRELARIRREEVLAGARQPS